MKSKFNNIIFIIYSIYCSIVLFFIIMNLPSVLFGMGSPVIAVLACIVLGMLGGCIITIIPNILGFQSKPQIQNKFFKGINILLATTLILSLVGCAVGIGNIINTPSQYERDLYNAMHKNIDEMTPEEKNAFENYLEWELKEKKISK